MDVIVSIPDDIAAYLSRDGVDLSRRALESFALEELRAGRITEVQLRGMLHLGEIELDGFLKEHGVFTAPSFAHLQKTNPEEWGRQFHTWAESHDRTTPLLSDEAISRDSIYPDRLESSC